MVEACFEVQHEGERHRTKPVFEKGNAFVQHMAVRLQQFPILLSEAKNL